MRGGYPMFLPKITVLKMAKLSGFADYKMVNDVNGGVIQL